MACPVSSFMAIRISENADAIALIQRIMQQPLEGPPIGMHLHRALNARVVRHLDIGTAAADMRKDDAVLARQRREELRSTIGVARKVAVVVDERMRRPVDLLAFVHEQDIAVAAETRIPRPLVAGEDDKRSVTIVLSRQFVEFVPERCGDLEVVALMAHAVEKGAVARELDQLSGGIGANSFL